MIIPTVGLVTAVMTAVVHPRYASMPWCVCVCVFTPDTRRYPSRAFACAYVRVRTRVCGCICVRVCASTRARVYVCVCVHMCACVVFGVTLSPFKALGHMTSLMADANTTADNTDFGV